MRQALHIFRKDVCHLWPQIAIALALNAAFAWIQSKPFYAEKSSGVEGWAGIITWLMVLSWWYLTASLIHQESLPGDRQFWLTRPYSRASLVAAKVVFLAVFINIPFFISDCVIVANQGFSPAAAMGSLFLRQAALCILLLPMAAVASLTRSTAEFVLACLMILAVAGVGVYWSDQHRSTLGSAMSWSAVLLGLAALLIGALAILALQYARRRTTVSRCIVAAALALCIVVPPITSADFEFAIESHFPTAPAEVSGLPITLAPRRELPREVSTALRDIIVVLVPTEVSGLPPEMDLISDLTRVTAEGAAGALTDYFWNQDPRVVTLLIDSSKFAVIKSQRLTLRISMFLTVLRKEKWDQWASHPWPANRTFPLDGVGLCSIGPKGEWTWAPALVCRSPFPMAARIQVRAGAKEQWWREDPWPLSFRVTPIFSQRWDFTRDSPGLKWDSASNGYVFPPDFKITFTSERPIAHIRRDLVIPNVRLADCVAPPEKP
jgi:hypothetical protein